MLSSLLERHLKIEDSIIIPPSWTWNLYHCSVTADILTETAAAMVKTGLNPLFPARMKMASITDVALPT